MNLFHCNFFSKTLKNHVDLNVLIPTMKDNECLNAGYDEIYKKSQPFKTLYLLHGALDDYSSWIRHTSIERYAEEKGIAVVMPSGQNGFYSNAIFGLNYYDFITEELPNFIRATFNSSSKREDNFIAGPSMGGYGATKCALLNPDKYGAFADLSGAVDPEKLEPQMVALGFDFFRYDLIFGGSKNVTNSKDDLYLMAKNLKDSKNKPNASIACGLEDVVNYPMNIKLKETLEEANVNVTFIDGHGGHDWVYWDKCIEQFINSLN